MNAKSSKERPYIVKVLVILNIFVVLFSILLIAAFTSLFSTVGLGLMPISVIGIWSIYYILMAYGLWNGKSWAWSLTMFFSILSLLGLIVLPIQATLNLTKALTESIDIIFAVAVIYGLTRPQVKTFFGKEKYSLLDWYLGRKKT